ncbi:ABC transporter permease [Terrihabitans sp. B22-R8]|uniref:ABC transporter permease n=1 Tax=Terrihabitans sp. B22-R8 TaxID=3425128 RepID=UPI00403D28D6
MTPLRIFGLAGLVFLAIVAIFGPLVIDHDPARSNLAVMLVPPGTPGHLLGTDHLGRDLLARLVSGARLTLSMAALAVFTAASTGVILGMIAGWRGGLLDRVLNSLADGVLAIPGLLLVLLLAAVSPDSWWTLYIGLSLTLWVEFFRVTRARTLVLRKAPAIEAAGLMGLGIVHVVRRHLWPDLSGQILTLAAFGAATVVTALATLGFIAVGLRPPTPEWGLMMAELLPSWIDAPWALAAPILCLAFTVACLRLAAGRGEFE